MTKDNLSAVHCACRPTFHIVGSMKRYPTAHSPPLPSPSVRSLDRPVLPPFTQHPPLDSHAAPPLSPSLPHQVDYSSIYGTDCPAVDTIIMDESLGPHLSWEDHQQFLGRLRRDGTAVFLSKHTMRMALLGRELAGPEEVGVPSLSSLPLSLPLFLSKHTMRMALLGRELAGPEEVGALRSPLLPTSLVDRFAQPCNRS
jgi:hypothetical protein